MMKALTNLFFLIKTADDAVQNLQFFKNKLWILARKQPLFSWRADAILKA